MHAPQLVSIQVGQPTTRGTEGAADPHDRPWTSAFYKTPLAGPVDVGPAGVAGDAQADRENHGGPDKAVLAYSADHYDSWRAELSLPELPLGAFGENFTIAGLTEETVCIGDTWELGPLLLQVTQPRQPCWKLARRWRLTQLPALVQQNGRTGWYCRILRAGRLAAPAPCRLLARPHPHWTVAAANQVLYHRRDDRDAVASLARLPELSTAWQTMLRKRLAEHPAGDRLPAS